MNGIKVWTKAELNLAIQQVSDAFAKAKNLGRDLNLVIASLTDADLLNNFASGNETPANYTEADLYAVRGVATELNTLCNAVEATTYLKAVRSAKVL